MNLVDRLKSAHSLFGDPLHHEAWEEIERLHQQVEDLALVARGAAHRIEDARKSQRFLAMIDKAVGGK